MSSLRRRRKQFWSLDVSRREIRKRSQGNQSDLRLKTFRRRKYGHNKFISDRRCNRHLGCRLGLRDRADPEPAKPESNPDPANPEFHPEPGPAKPRTTTAETELLAEDETVSNAGHAERDSAGGPAGATRRAGRDERCATG